MFIDYIYKKERKPLLLIFFMQNAKMLKHQRAMKKVSFKSSSVSLYMYLAGIIFGSNILQLVQYMFCHAG